MVRFTGSLADNRLPDMAALASLLRDRMPFAVRLGLLAPRLAPLAAVALARMTALIPDQHELLLLADQLRDWTRDDPRLAPRTIRLRELLVELLDPTGSAEVARSLPEDDDCREGNPMTRLYCGIDPGLTGAIALVNADGSLFAVEDMPVQARGSGRVRHEVDAAGLLHLLRPHAGAIAFGLVERVGARPGQGVASMFSLGHSTGVLDGVLGALGIPHQVVTPTNGKGLPASPPTRASSSPLPVAGGRMQP